MTSYGIPMRQLAQFQNDENQALFAAPRMYWHKKVFGTSAGREGRGSKSVVQPAADVHQRTFDSGTQLPESD